MWNFLEKNCKCKKNGKKIEKKLKQKIKHEVKNQSPKKFNLN